MIGMKNLILLTVMAFISFTSQASTCSSPLDVVDARFDENFSQIQAVVSAGMQRQELLSANISYGRLSLGAGTSRLSLEIVEGRIVNLNIDTNVRMAGISFERMQNKINVRDFSNGQTLSFKMDGADHPALVITPGSGFNSRGGRVSIKTWTGRLNSQGRPIYTEPTLLYIGADAQDRYSLYKAPSATTAISQVTQSRNRVTGLRINMRGNALRPATLYAGSYRITTQGG